jgi:Protein of unknown function (DUF2380)
LNSRLVGAALLIGLISQPSFAATKAAVFPFELVIPAREEDFFTGASKPTPAEEARLKLVYDEFVELLKTKVDVEAIDLTPVAAELAAKRPIQDCNGCEIDIAKKAGADIAYVMVLEKASDTLLNLNLTEVDVQKGSAIKRVSAVVNGNTDDAWLGVVRWVVRNRLAPKPEVKP